MEREKGVIIEEINMYEDMPNHQVQELWMRLLYGDTPAGWSIAGTKQNILAMKQEDFVNYHRKHYKEVIKEVKKIFGSMKRGHKGKKIKVREAQSRPKALINFKKTDQTHFVLGVRTYDLFDKRNAALSVLAGVLGGGMSSRLFVKLREEMGVGYYVRAGNDAYTDHGFFQISVGVDNKRIEEVLKAILEECQKLKTAGVGEEELKKVKEFLIGNMKLSLESTDDIANFYGGQELLKRELKNAEDKAKEIRKVTAKEIQTLA
ncbi:MAG: Peptidase M16 domain protein, partial [Parcubacteria group bacterium GW2011_GWF2_42_7]